MNTSIHYRNNTPLLDRAFITNSVRMRLHNLTPSFLFIFIFGFIAVVTLLKTRRYSVCFLVLSLIFCFIDSWFSHKEAEKIIADMMELNST